MSEWMRAAGTRRTSSSIVTSIILWLKYAGLFFTTFTATTSCVFMFWHLTTCPNVPCPRISRIRYLFHTMNDKTINRSAQHDRPNKQDIAQ